MNNAPLCGSIGLIKKWQNWKDWRDTDTLISKLGSQKRLPIPLASHDPVIKQANGLLKKISRFNDPRIQKLKLEIRAAKLGIDSSILERHPDFAAFAEKSHLHQYLMEYKDEIKIDTDGQLLIKMNSVYTPWHSAKKAFEELPKSTTFPQQPWIYGPQGLQWTDMYDWKTLTPFKRDDPSKWGNQYIFEFCACNNPVTIKNGNHSWIRLKTPSGEIYSVGLYRPEKTNPVTDNFKSPLRVKPGYLMQPDVSEFWPFPVYTIPVAITEANFLQMKAMIEEDKARNDQTFQLFGDNCTLYCAKVAALAGISLPTSERLVELVAPPALKWRISFLFNHLPRFVQKICDFAQAFFVNGLEVIFGAAKIDAHLNSNQRKRAVPHIASWWDLFKPIKAHLNHPNTLAFKTRSAVLAWREKKVRKILHHTGLSIEQKQAQFNKILFDLPSKFRLPAATPASP